MAISRPKLFVFLMVAGLVVVGASLVRHPAHAQGDHCGDLYQTAVDYMLGQCGAMRPGTVCVSTDGVQVFSSDGAWNPAASGIPLSGIGQIATESTADSFGVARVEVPAIEEGLFLSGVLFGDATLRNDPGEPQGPVCNARSLGSINVRAEPSTDASILGQLQLDRTAPILSRLQDGSWWQIVWDGTPAWIFAELAPADCDPETMLVYDLATGELSGGIPAPDYQGGVLESSFETAVCEGVPQGGLLLQSPAGGASWRLHGMTLRLDGTVLLQAGANDVLLVEPLAGQVTLEIAGINRPAQVGQLMRVPLRNGQPDGFPGPVLDAVSGEVALAPLALLPEPVEVPAPTLSRQAEGPGLACSVVPQQAVQIAENGVAIAEIELTRPQSIRLSVTGEGVTGLQIVDTEFSLSDDTSMVMDLAEGELAAGRYQVQAVTTGASEVVFGLTCDLPQIASQEIGQCDDFLLTWTDVVGGQVRVDVPGGARVSVLVQHDLPSEGPAESLSVSFGDGAVAGVASFTSVGDAQVAGPLVFEAPADAVYAIGWDGDPFSPASVEVICMPSTTGE